MVKDRLQKILPHLQRQLQLPAFETDYDPQAIDKMAGQPWTSRFFNMFGGLLNGKTSSFGIEGK